MSNQGKREDPFKHNRDEVVAQTMEPKENDGTKICEESYADLEIVAVGCYDKVLQETVLPKSTINVDGNGAFIDSHIDKGLYFGGFCFQNIGVSGVDLGKGLVGCQEVDIKDSDPISVASVRPIGITSILSPRR